MSISGPAPEQNDASDWLLELREVLYRPHRGVHRKGYLDVDRCTEAVAAAQVLTEACDVAG